MIKEKIKNNKILKKIFLQKKSRVVEDNFLKKWSQVGLTVDIGGKDKGNKKYFQNLKVINIDSGPEVDIVANAEDLTDCVDDNYFDNVLCLSVLEHVKNPQKAVSEIKRILKPDGLVIISVPFVMTLHDTPNDYWRFTKYGVLELFKDFEVVEINDNLDSLQTMGYMYHRLFLQTKVFGSRFFSLFFWLNSKINYLFHNIISHEYGYINHSRKEECVFSNNILAVFKKK